MDSFISGKYYGIEQDSRFPLSFSGAWQPFTGEKLSAPSGCMIYGISGNNTLYIGSSCTDGRRPATHRQDFRRGDHENSYMQRTVTKYGLQVMFFQPLCVIPPDVTLHRDLIENAYIKHFDTYHNGFNLMEFADTPSLGRPVSAATRAKISASNKGKKMSPEQRKKTIAALTGRPVLQATRDKLRAKFSGRYVSPETREKLRQANLGKKLLPDHVEKLRKANSKPKSPEHRRKIGEGHSKPFSLVHSDTGEIVHGSNINRFAKERGLDFSSLAKVICGTRPAHKGWQKL